MKLKNKKIVGLFALLPFWAKACITFVIGCVILIVGSIVIYELYQMQKVLNNVPPPQQANNINDWASSWSISFDDTNGNMYAHESGGYNPYWGYINYTNHAYAPSLMMQPARGFQLQYGLDATNAPWIVPGNALNTNQAVYVQTLIDTESTYSVAFTSYGITTIYTATTNGESGGKMTIDATTNAVVTNSMGDSVISHVNAPELVIIERTTNYFQTWQPIFTNTIRCGEVHTFIDPGASAAVQPNMMPPITGNTNGGTGPMIVTGVFYRLKLQ